MNKGFLYFSCRLIQFLCCFLQIEKIKKVFAILNLTNSSIAKTFCIKKVNNKGGDYYEKY